MTAKGRASKKKGEPFPAAPIAKWYGGGYERGPWTVSHFVRHTSYYEPFVGPASILGFKPKIEFETVTDTNGRLVNLLTVIRDRVDELVTLLNLTPWAEAEWEKAQVQAEDPLEDARRYWFACWSSIRGGPPDPKNTFAWNVGPESRYSSSGGTAKRHDLLRWARRLEHVQILWRSAFDVLPAFLGAADTLIYADPPYVLETRSRKNGYHAHEFTEKNHRQLADLLRAAAGCVVISGYRSDLYAELYEAHGWERNDKEFSANNGATRVESIWLNPMLQRRRAVQTLPLFAVPVVP